ncbi:DUF4442 domain-containing protein [Enterovibrio norvegicus]|uniref:DUF4442 domain-containing protein n=1 Tax=Enterovibrio norvegicus TaxID=188144 RepID=A0ABV4KZX5_9GAMM|nr:DUF4442 domain-containing protein [Enterovibrio norvegicus]MCC4797939.1 DUF4442 domain-containing protein [Enterovibrio norvegicus]OEE51518.1 DUF4442 domain-containing protein [Enterovibrio norvegicus]OEF58740.1 DUF4442 domain-containing protein [Enterovibrio norvegicus]PMH72548.1 DUF4442 domain-containing protein [Enterovibrio norvegicus]PMI30077.1 DUF4442 domain-containing protein [Enterovibrio norvegicus]
MYKYYKPQIVKFALNCWPPFWGAGIKIMSISDDFRATKVRLKLRWWNKNANRTQYGGSIFSMTDPIYALMLMGILREEYFVWDKEADINFIKPGASALFADFVISEDVVTSIKQQTAGGDKVFPEFIVNVKNDDGEVVARVRRVLYVRKKPDYRKESKNKHTQTT